MNVALIYVGTLVCVVLIAVVPALYIDYSQTRTYRKHDRLLTPENDSLLERWHLARKTGEK